jgi:hypothetical protein
MYQLMSFIKSPSCPSRYGIAIQREQPPTLVFQFDPIDLLADAVLALIGDDVLQNSYSGSGR